MRVQLAVSGIVAQECRDRATAARCAIDAGRLAQQAAAIVAGRIVRRIAVHHTLLKIAVVSLELQRHHVANIHIAAQPRLDIAIGHCIGCGELRRWVGREQLYRRRAGAVDYRIGCGQIQVNLNAVVLDAPITVEILDVGRLQIAPAILVDHAARGIERLVAALLAVLNIALDLPERSAGNISFTPMIRKSILQRHVDRAAQRIQPEHRVTPLHIQLADRHVRDQVPVHRVAKRLIETDAVRIDGNALRCALQRRHFEAVIENRWLVLVARCAIEIDPRHLRIQRLQHVGRTLTRNVGAAQHLGFGRD